MSGPLTRSAYVDLVDGNLRWLDQQTPTLERDHVRVIVYRSDEAVREEIARREREEIAARDDLARRAICAPWVEVDALETLADLLVIRGEIVPHGRKRRRSGRKYARREERDKHLRRAELLGQALDWAWRRYFPPQTIAPVTPASIREAIERLLRSYEEQNLLGLTPVPASPMYASGSDLDRVADLFGMSRIQSAEDESDDAFRVRISQYLQFPRNLPSFNFLIRYPEDDADG